MDKQEKEERLQILQKLLDKEMEELRLKCFAWKRRPFLYREVIIKEKKFTRKSLTIGQHVWDEKRKKHIVYIDQRYMKSYLLLKQYKIYPSKPIREIKEVLRHELAHAFVEERYKNLINKTIKGVALDGSPIFLTFLNFIGGISNHKAFGTFKHSNMYYETSSCESFEELDNYLIDSILEYKRIVQKYDIIQNQEVKQDNNFYFGNGKECGLKVGRNVSSYKYIGNNKKIKNSYYYEQIIIIGSAIGTDSLEKLFAKKLYDNSVANNNYYAYKKNGLFKVWDSYQHKCLDNNSDVAV